MTDRDHFAAAALTGLLVHANDGIDEETLDTPSDIAYTAYAMADAMLRERGNHIADAGKMAETSGETNHDAAPAARADLPDERPPNAVSANGGTPCAASRDGSGTGDTPVAESATTAEPVAWAVVYPNDEVAVIAFKRRDADERATASDRIIPLYRQPQPMLTDAEREAVERVSVAYDLLPTQGAQQVSATLRGLLERTQ